MSEQEQFLDVIDRDEAERRFLVALSLEPLGAERVALDAALGRVLARDVVSPVDVPSFDRSNYDGYAVRAADTFGADEEHPKRLRRLDEVIATAVEPQSVIEAGTTATIATGGMVPRGADAIVMVEHAEEQNREVLVRRAVTPGFGVAYAGTDVTAGETVLRRGVTLTSRETGVLAAIGIDGIDVWRRPKVGILSTGDEIIAPGEAMRPGMVYDSNARIIADAVREIGGEAIALGIVRDDTDELRRCVHEALATCDAVLLSGGTSKGAGDLSYQVVREMNDPGIVAHGVALKPGKPICLAASAGKPVVVLPGFPTSAIFTFHEFVAPVIRRLAGAPPQDAADRSARMAVRVNSEIGRTEYLLVGLVGSPDAGAEPSAYPMGKGSGSVTTFSQADGFITIGRHEEIVERGAPVSVRMLGRGLRIADLVVIGSHCVGLDYLLGLIQQRGLHTRFLAVGSTAGLEAACRGECDVAGIHLLDPETGRYNAPFLTEDLELVTGYRRMQGVLHRPGDERFEGRSAEAAIAAVRNDPSCLMVNRNQGSGTRMLIDRLLDGARPDGYAVQARNHNAVAAAVVQRRADWGVAIHTVSQHARLGFLPVAEEHFDFVIPKSRLDRPAVVMLRGLLDDADVRRRLASMGMSS
ncbi:MAG: molybdopterin biosynthesis protein [Phycisphaeraceae bacterium]|nr:molybdopterin biosynthesis protein [Phycisphaeraceae bacterium]